MTGLAMVNAMDNTGNGQDNKTNDDVGNNTTGRDGAGLTDNSANGMGMGGLMLEQNSALMAPGAGARFGVNGDDSSDHSNTGG